MHAIIAYENAIQHLCAYSAANQAVYAHKTRIENPRPTKLAKTISYDA